jgi:hypothetical protein
MSAYAQVAEVISSEYVNFPKDWKKRLELLKVCLSDRLSGV